MQFRSRKQNRQQGTQEVEIPKKIAANSLDLDSLAISAAIDRKTFRQGTIASKRH
jgi:hypothetical protein